MKRRTKVLSWIGGIILVLLLLVFAANIFLENKIESAIKENLTAQKISYKDVSVNVLAGNSSIKNPSINKDNFTFSADKVEVKDLDYTAYLFHKRIVIDALEIENPEIALIKVDSVSKTSADTTSANASFKKDILLKNIDIKGGYFKIVKNDSVKLYLKLQHFNLNQVSINKKSVKNKLPFNYKNMQLTVDSLYKELDSRQFLTISNLDLNNNRFAITNLQLKSLYNKVDFQKHISVEHDRYDLVIDSIAFNDFKWKFVNDSLQLKSPFAVVNHADFNIYRNKLLPDDNTFKPLYSQMLRNSGVKMKFDSIQIKNSKIVYEEKEVEDRPAGRIIFEDVNVAVNNLQNIGMGKKDFPQTKIQAKAQFLGKSTLTLNWDFYVNNLQDKFHISGNLNELSADAMNSFLTPFKNIKAQGQIESLSYNFYGDNDNAKGDMNLKYKDFKIKVLQKDGSEKNSFISGLVNLIVNNNAENSEVENRDITAKRNKTRSFWNYAWTCIRNGALKSFVKF